MEVSASLIRIESRCGESLNLCTELCGGATGLNVALNDDMHFLWKCMSACRCSTEKHRWSFRFNPLLANGTFWFWLSERFHKYSNNLCVSSRRRGVNVGKGRRFCMHMWASTIKHCVCVCVWEMLGSLGTTAAPGVCLMVFFPLVTHTHTHSCRAFAQPQHHQ